MLGTLLEETRGFVGAALGTTEGELRGTAGNVEDAGASAAVAASLTGELHRLGTLLGLGDLGVVSLRAANAARVFARQANAAVMIEVDPRRSLNELEAKLTSVAWAPRDFLEEQPAVGRVPTRPLADPLAQLEEVNEFELPDGMALPDDFELPVDAEVVPMSEQVVPGEWSDLPVWPDKPRHDSNSAPLPLPPPPPQAAPRAATIPPSRPTPAPRLTPPPANLLPRPPRPLTPPPIAVPSVPMPTRPMAQSPAPQPPPPAPAPAPASNVGSGPVFTGDLEEFHLPDLLEFLRNTHRTGLLMCTSPEGIGTVQMSRGMIIGADSPNAVSLREHFLTNPEIDVERRRQLISLPAECFAEDTIDVMVAGRDLASKGDVEAARSARIYSAFREMMAWKTGRFSFDPGVPISSNPPIALSAQTILMHLFQEQDEANR